MPSKKLKERTGKGSLPQHIAIVMDGNGRWAQQRGLPRTAGHKEGVKAVRRVVEQCSLQGVGVLTLFAFSSENWKRPQKEVGILMDLFFAALHREVKRLNRNQVRLKIIGERRAFSEKLQRRILEAENKTAENTGLILQVAANYGGRWDILQATRKLAEMAVEGTIDPGDIDEARLAGCLSFSDLPDPDLFIRTGGEVRLSNFMLWQTAYSELYFTKTLWPDFGEKEFAKSLSYFAKRERRFGLTRDQVKDQETRQ